MISDPYDVVVFGATSFVGKLVTQYLCESQQHTGLRWAIAGRSRDKLQQLIRECGEQAKTLPMIVADAHDANSLQQLCKQTRVVASTVGPYALYGEALVKACAESGTDYCDLTGEVQWMASMIQRYQKTAQTTGARIVHACGFDAIPSDLGVYYCQQQAQQQFGHYCDKIKMRIKKIRGGFSGGTIASMLNGIKEAKTNPEIKRLLADPYSLCPKEHCFDNQQHSPRFEYDDDFQSWTAPFVMAAINTRVVFRSNYLLDNRYGYQFRYDEGMLTGYGNKGKWRARTQLLSLGLFAAAIALAPSRWLLEKFVLPKPGEGPSTEDQRKGFFDLHFIGRTPDGLVMHTQVTGDRDPGYGATAKMLSQAALTLAFDRPKQVLSGGFWTPSAALGDHLIERLNQFAGMRFTVCTDEDARCKTSPATPSQ